MNHIESPYFESQMQLLKGIWAEEHSEHHHIAANWVRIEAPEGLGNRSFLEATKDGNVVIFREDNSNTSIAFWCEIHLRMQKLTMHIKYLNPSLIRACL